MTADPRAAADRRTFIPLDPSLAPPGTRAFRDAGGIPADQWHADQNGETLVPTHCCFCGVQCGMYLRVDRGGKVFGVEPRNHDINRMRLCPKGINAYQQVNHPDRLTAPLMRRSRDEEFREVSWEEALDFTVSEIKRIQQTHGNDAFGLLGGASLFSEKTYLVGKFARVALKTRHVDYNGRLCMVSAAGANKLAFGIDRAGNPFSDILLTDCLLIAGSNVGECFPVMTQYVWGARDRGASLIVIDPRETAIARTADIHVALKPGTDSAFFTSVLHVVIEEGLTDENYLAAHATGWEEVKAKAAEYPPSRAAAICGIPAEQIVQVARTFARAPKAMAWHARGIEHHSQGVENCLTVINLCTATGHIGKPGAGYGTITGQGNGQGGREHGQKSDLLPGGRSIMNEEHRRQICEIWGIEESELPPAGTSMMEMVWQMQRREIRGLIGICNNPFVSLPNYQVVKEGYDTTEFHAQFDFFLSETAANAHVVFPVTTWAEDEGVMANAEARVVKHNKAQDPPPGVRTDTWAMCELARRLGAGDKFDFPDSRSVFDELRVASAGTVNDYYGITYERLEETGGIAWPCPTTDHPGTPASSRTGRPTTPTARSTSRSSNGTRRWTRTTTSTPCRSPPAAPSPTSSPATRPAGSAPSSSRPHAPGPRSTPPTASATASPSASSPGAAARSSPPSSPKRSAPTPYSSRITGPSPPRPTPSPSTPSTPGPRSPSTRCAPAASSTQSGSTRYPPRRSLPAMSPTRRPRSPVPTRCLPRPLRAVAPRRGAEAP